MWFKNIIVYQLSENFTLTPEQLHDKLYDDMTRPCGKLEKTTFGWMPPLGKNYEMLVHAANGCYLLAARKEEKILPTSVVRDHVQARIEKIRAEEGRDVNAREKRNLMDEMSITLLPQAFSKGSVTYGYIDTKNGWLVVDSSSNAKAEEFTVLLRKSLGSLKVLPLQAEQKPAYMMTQWIKHREMPEHFCIEDYCEMIRPDAQATVIKCLNQDLFAKEVVMHLDSGKEVIKLAMSWRDRVSFVIDGELILRRVKFLELVQEQVKDIAAETYEDQFDADFVIFASEFAQMLPDVFGLFGGVKVEKTAHSKESHAIAEIE